MSASAAPSRHKRADTVVDAVLVIFCAMVYWETTRFPEVPAMLSQNVPPTFFPRLVLSVIILLSTLLFFRRGRDAKESSEATAPVSRAVVLTAAFMTVAVTLISYLGTFATLTLTAIGLPLLWGERRPWRIGLLAVALPAFVYLVFALALGMRFPTGLLP